MQVELHGAQLHQGWIYLAPGSWVTAFYLGAHNSPIAVSSPPDLTDPSSAALAGVCQCAAAGVSVGIALLAKLRRYCHSVEMWRVWVLASAFADGAQIFTPFPWLFLWICVLLHRGLHDAVTGHRISVARGAQITHGRPLLTFPVRSTLHLCFAIAAFTVIQPVGGVQLYGRQPEHQSLTVSDSSALSFDRFRQPPNAMCSEVAGHPYCHPSARPIPTPCRALYHIPEASPPEDLEVEVQRSCTLTLLRQSILQDPTPYFLAVTLLETLIEHFEASSGAPQARNKPHASEPIQHQDDRPVSQVSVLALDVLIPDHTSTPSPDWLGHGALLASVAAQESGEVVKLGHTPCDFNWGELHNLLSLRFELKAFRELAAVSPQRAEAVLKAVPLLVNPDLQTSWVCYTDGSFYAATALRAEQLGWAFIFVEPQQGFLAWLSGAVPDWAVREAGRASAYLAECFALCIAQLCAALHFGGYQITFRSDCQSAVGLAKGTMSYLPGATPQALAHVVAFRRGLIRAHDNIEYVPGHAGNVLNEAADTLAKLGARSQCFCTGPTECTALLKHWLQRGGHRFPWAATALCSLSGDSCLPPIQGDLGDDTNHGPLTAHQLVEPFLPAAVTDACSERASMVQAMRLNLLVCSFNVLTLGAFLEDSEGSGVGEAGLRYRPGRAALLAAQLHTLGAHVVALQETRCPQGTPQVGQYARFSSGAQHGQFGTEIWLHTTSQASFRLPRVLPRFA